MKTETFEESKRMSSCRGFLGYKNGSTIVNGVVWKSKKKIGKPVIIYDKF